MEQKLFYYSEFLTDVIRLEFGKGLLSEFLCFTWPEFKLDFYNITN